MTRVFHVYFLPLAHYDMSNSEVLLVEESVNMLNTLEVNQPLAR